MNVPIVMPQMGQSMAEGTIVRWRKKVGDAVALDEVILEVESDKISIRPRRPRPASRMRAPISRRCWCAPSPISAARRRERCPS